MRLTALASMLGMEGSQREDLSCFALDTLPICGMSAE